MVTALDSNGEEMLIMFISFIIFKLLYRSGWPYESFICKICFKTQDIIFKLHNSS